MPKSEFDAEIPIIGSTIHPGGRVQLSGAAAIDTEPEWIHWLVEQTGIMTSGVIQVSGQHWTDSQVTGAPSDWQEGPARAVGHLVSLTPDGAETFSWSQTVTLKRR